MIRPLLAAALAATALLAAADAPAQQPTWQALIRAEDRARLDAWHSTVFGNIARIAPGNYYAITPAELRQLISQQPGALDERALVGNWRCRSVQIPSAGVFAYPPFACAIRQTPQGLFFEKTAGSQRLSGLLYPDGGARLVLLGGATVNEEPQRAYVGGAPDDVVGTLIAVSRDRAMLRYTGQTGPQLYEMTRGR